MKKVGMKNANNREGAEELALSSGKFDRYEYLTGDEIFNP